MKRDGGAVFPVEGFRNPEAAARLVADIQRLGGELSAANRRCQIMEVCGTHTHVIAKSGIRRLLPKCVNLVSGPGCPVCVTEPGYIDAALKLAASGVVIATFGDMVRVPGSHESLAELRARGADIQICYSPRSAMEFARAHPENEVAFLAIGFETTVAPLLVLVLECVRLGIPNLSFLTAFKQVPPVLEALAEDPDLALHGLICPGHVSAIIGANAYRPFAEKRGIPCVITGFEPLDVLLALKQILASWLTDEAGVFNHYSRVVREQGNSRAQALMAEHLSPCDATWRGLGKIPKSGLRLADHLANYDAQRRYNLDMPAGRVDPNCRCGEVLKGKMTPAQCQLFGGVCTPHTPRGPCMVSSEGCCAANYRYQGA